MDQGRDAADWAMISKVKEGDLAVTQDYGLASLVLSRKAFAFHQDGWQYTEENIEGLLQQRYEAAKARRSSKNHMKGPAKRDRKQNEIFFQRLCDFLRHTWGNEREGK